MPDLADLFPGYASEWINTQAGRIFARVGGKGPPLLLLHGFSETHVMWHRVAPQLADKFTVIVADLPGYGWSDMPESDKDHIPYTKRAMAQTMIEAMEQLGHVHFALAGHDRGGRVAYRLALDHPGRLSKLAVLDILPTYNYWDRMNRLYALKIYHWTFLAQAYPLPETLIGGNPDFFLRFKMASQTKSKNLDAIDPRALEHYLAAFRDPSRVHAMCEDYRAGAYADFEIDKADLAAGNKITIPMLALWGDAGIASAAATPLDTWKNWASNVTGAPVNSGHFLCEEDPDATAKALKEFFWRGECSVGSAKACPATSAAAAKNGCVSLRLWTASRMALRLDRWRTLSPHLEKLPQQRRRLSLAHRRINFRRVVAGRGCKEPNAGFHAAALGVRRAVIQPPDPRERDCSRAHRARFQRDIEVAIDQPLGADGLGGLPDRQDFGMRSRISLGQGAVGGGGDDLVIPDNHASNRDFAGFSGVFGCFQRQIHERRGGHASYHRQKPAMRCAFSKSGNRFCVRMRLE